MTTDTRAAYAVANELTDDFVSNFQDLLKTPVEDVLAAIRVEHDYVYDEGGATITIAALRLIEDTARQSREWVEAVHKGAAPR